LLAAAFERIIGELNGCVYILRSGEGNVFKVGRSTDLAKRRKTHATGNPELLTEFAVIETEHAAKCETYLKHRLRSKRHTRGEGTEWFDVDPDELAVVVEDARHYAQEVLPIMAEAERLSEQACDGRILSPSDGVIETYRALVHVREEYDTLGFEKDHLEAQLKLVIGRASGIERVADWKTVLSHRIDSDRLKIERPDVYSAFVAETRSRRFNLL
jgi:predicted GIY-YIG superfamily endonuclease